MIISKIRLRMYNVGFGDAFLLTLEHNTGDWRMLIDCGVHTGGASSHPMREIVGRIISDITPAGGNPQLDVVVATHRHRDHVSGFDDDRWDTVTVGEVWLPFTENPNDALGRSIRDAQARKAARLHAFLQGLAAQGDNTALKAARVVENSLTNAKAMDRLHHGFAGQASRRYFPDIDGQPISFNLNGLTDTTVHMLGPRRDKSVIATMDPPTDQRWLRALALTTPQDAPTITGLFAPAYNMDDGTIERDYTALFLEPKTRNKLEQDTRLDIWAAAASITGATNNTSLVFVLDVAGTKLLFPGDAQWGLWNAILDEPEAEALLHGTHLYKVGHHGSHNGSLKHYVQDLMGQDTISMMSFHSVADWPSIPNPALVDALEGASRQLIRSDKPTSGKDPTWDGDMVAELSITT